MEPPAPEPELYTPTEVVQWNEVALAAVRNGPPRPTVISRSLFLLHSAMYDAWAAYDDEAVGVATGNSLRRPPAQRSLDNQREAISHAAYRILINQFPAYEQQTGAFRTLLANLGYGISDSTDLATPAGVGNAAAQAVLEDRADDGSNAANNYAEHTWEDYPEALVPTNSPDPASSNAPGGADFDPNTWQPLRVPTGTMVDSNGIPAYDSSDPGSYTDQRCLTPHWGAVRPFALESGAQFRPGPPPMAGSDEPYTDALGNTMTNDEAYRQQVNEILFISKNLTDAQKVIAEYWADGPRSETPPGHWNALAHGVALRDRHTLEEDVKLFFVLNGALFDAGIATWETKRYYNYVRPVSAIAHMYAGQNIMAWGGPDLGTIEMPGENWRPYQSPTFVTPAFPEYTSGHSTFSAAAAEVLTRFAGSDAFYDGTTVLYNEDFNNDGLADLLGEHIVGVGRNMFENSPSEIVVLRWATFQDAADEAGLSRRYGGIHFQDADLRGRDVGKKVGEVAFERAEELWSGEAP
jgi:hypothetical protein